MTITTRAEALLAQKIVQDCVPAILQKFDDEMIADFPGAGDQGAIARAAARFAKMQAAIGRNQEEQNFLRDVADWFAAHEARPDLSPAVPAPAPGMPFIVVDPRTATQPTAPAGPVIGGQQTYYAPIQFSAYANGKHDASPADTKVTHQGKTLVKMVIPSPFGLRQFWEAV